MTISQLGVFVKVVDMGSFTKAAEALNMTQSAVSHAIAGLEAELGVVLLIRNRRQGIILSDFGRRVLEPIRGILNGVAHIEQEAAAEKGLESGTIRVGSFPSAAARLLPKIMGTFEKLHPNIDIVLFEGTDQEVAEWLHSRVIDVGFVAQSAPGNDMIPLTKDKMVAVLPKDHVLGGSQILSVSALVDHPFIMSSGGCEPLIMELFSRSQCSPSVKFEVRDTATILNMVQEGLGITIVPEMALPDRTPNVIVKDLQPSMCRYLGLRCPFINEATPAVLSFIAVGQSLFQDEVVSAIGGRGVESDCKRGG